MTRPTSVAPLRVLVVDDDVDQRLLLRRLFGRAGIDDVVEATNGREALDIIGEVAPTIVVLDLAMPVLSGLDALPALVAAAPASRIVVLSNMSRRGVKDEVREHGAVGFVEKRVPPERLVEEILLAAALTSITVDRLSSATFPNDRSAPRLARGFVRELLSGEGEQLVSTVELLVSELTTNAVLHAHSAPHIDVRITPSAVRVDVFDEDPTTPVMRTPDLDSIGGRGLVLLDSLATRWDIEPRGDGKVVWFELDR